MFSEIKEQLRSTYLSNKVTLTRLGAPLLYAYDAKSFYQRLRGIHGVPSLGPTDAIILRPCNAVHTFGMKCPIDVVFVNRNGVILKSICVVPNRVVVCFGAMVAVEMAEGTAARIQLAVGQKFVPSHGEWT